MARRSKAPMNEADMDRFERVTAENIITLLHNYYDVRRYFEKEQEKSKDGPSISTPRNETSCGPETPFPDDLSGSDKCPRCDGDGSWKANGAIEPCPDCNGTGKRVEE
jgi:DnaJ-class molecular chaperone